MTLPSWLKNKLLPPDLEAQLNTMPKAVGSYGYDPWGYHWESAKIGFGLLKLLYDRYFRVEAYGLANIPKTGRVLIIPNHSGQLPMDGFLIAVAMATNPHGPRPARGMMERFFPTVPYIGNMLNSMGAALGDPVNCGHMLKAEEAIIVFPEGVRGSGKLFQYRYQLQRFGHGFMHLAIDYQTPIVPVGVVGCEETMPSIANIKPLARLLGVPYVPLTVPLPLPVKVIIHFGEPLFFQDGDTSEAAVAEKVESVKEAIRALIDKGMQQRKGLF